MNAIYQNITEAVIAALAAGTKPWVKPWDADAIGGAIPWNIQTGAAYRGCNVLALWATSMKKGYSTNAWATFKQVQELGGKVRKGEKATSGVYFKRTERTDEVSGEVTTIPHARAFYVFNLDQLEGVNIGEAQSGPTPFATNTEVETFIQRTGADIRVEGRFARYYPAHDLIQLPERERFGRAEDFYATALHELTHWTGHGSRLARSFEGRFGDKAYAFEELVAELGSAFLCARLGVRGELAHEDYIGSWLEILGNDSKAIVDAASLAQKASDFLYDIYSAGALVDGVAVVEEQRAA